MRVYWKGYHWPHVLFFTLTPLAAVVAVTWVVWNGGPHWGTWVLSAVMLFACGLATSGGYHRLFTHRTYKASWPVRLAYLFFGAASLQGSARWWACQHRYHHAYVDTDRDPYGINKGFWYAHIGWLFTQDQEPLSFENVRDLDQDPLIRWQHRFYPLIAVCTGYLLPIAIASLWGDPWGGFLVAGLGRMVVYHHCTFCVNSVCHYFGRQNYSDENSARDSWFAALLTYGEGYHNFHHAFQSDYRNGVRAYHWDPAKWVIWLLAQVRLVREIKKTRRERILFARLAMDQKRFAARVARSPDGALVRVEALLNATRAQLQQAYLRFLQLREEYRRGEQVRLAKQEFKFAMARWRSLIRGPSLADFNI